MRGMVRTRVLESLNDSDVARLGEILVAVVGAGASVGYLPPLELSKAEAYWRHAITRDVILLVAEVDGVIAGTVQLELATKVNARHRAEVNKLLVHPSFQRMGIGRALMAALEDEACARARTLLHLDTREGDTSNDFYRSQGWTEAGTIPMWAESSSGTLEGTVFYYKTLE